MSQKTAKEKRQLKQRIQELEVRMAALEKLITDYLDKAGK